MSDQSPPVPPSPTRGARPTIVTVALWFAVGPLILLALAYLVLLVIALAASDAPAGSAVEGVWTFVTSVQHLLVAMWLAAVALPIAVIALVRVTRVDAAGTGMAITAVVLAVLGAIYAIGVHQLISGLAEVAAS